ncbi:hypothetical protein [Sinorhizobium psoraleae]|uniref:Uncharacterized protein n=1 Tax=Sinorhizobium psoraleae TaxID=520838 RepID=A0ABT4KP14_9HYPH|nr:hypothetical protein [Sinorhizobium psoraleae]MCZ4093697.1 hypothetical protein [Sinorhizobium psoraleae]
MSTLTIAGLAVHSIEGYRQFTVRPMSAKLSQRLDGGRRHIARISAGLDARNAHLGVATAGPVD